MLGYQSIFQAGRGKIFDFISDIWCVCWRAAACRGHLSRLSIYRERGCVLAAFIDEALSD